MGSTSHGIFKKILSCKKFWDQFFWKNVHVIMGLKFLGKTLSCEKCILSFPKNYCVLGTWGGVPHSTYARSWKAVFLSCAEYDFTLKHRPKFSTDLQTWSPVKSTDTRSGRTIWYSWEGIPYYVIKVRYKKTIHLHNLVSPKWKCDFALLFHSRSTHGRKQVSKPPKYNQVQWKAAIRRLTMCLIFLG